jgi:quinoprotein glucose dehydrogenase
MRPGNSLFAESIVCLDAKTGKRVWHFQTLHHGLWDYDLPAAPILGDIKVNGRTIKALAQVTKQAYTFVLDRTNGKPIWPIEERPVPKGEVPGEWYSPTQPIPSKPPAFDQQGVTDRDLLDPPELADRRRSSRGTTTARSTRHRKCQTPKARRHDPGTRHERRR